MPYSHSTALVLRAPPPVAVAFAHAPLPTASPSDVPSPLPGQAVRPRVGCWAARARSRWVFRALSKPPYGGSRASWLLGGLASAPAWAQLRASLSDINIHRSSCTRSRSTHPRLRVAAAVSPLLVLSLPCFLPRSRPAAVHRVLMPPSIRRPPLRSSLPPASHPAAPRPLPPPPPPAPGTAAAAAAAAAVAAVPSLGLAAHAHGLFVSRSVVAAANSSISTNSAMM